MSKAFTKEDDEPRNERLDDLPQSPHPNYVTPAGFAALNDRLLARRAGLADLRKKGEGIDNWRPIAIAQRDIRFLEERIKRAIVVEPGDQPHGVVAFGAEVEVSHDDIRQTYRIVGEDEAEPARGLIAPFSPLALALLGARVGDTVEWRKPAGAVDLEVTAIRFR